MSDQIEGEISKKTLRMIEVTELFADFFNWKTDYLTAWASGLPGSPVVMDECRLTSAGLEDIFETMSHKGHRVSLMTYKVRARCTIWGDDLPENHFERNASLGRDALFRTVLDFLEDQRRGEF